VSVAKTLGYVVNSVADLPTNTLTDILLLKHIDLSFTENSAFAVILPPWLAQPRDGNALGRPAASLRPRPAATAMLIMVFELFDL
jgi:hypothetical protein